MIRFLVAIWRERQRQTDLRVLWPICKRQAPDLDHAKQDFARHARNDPAWLALDEDHVRAVIDNLD